MNEEIKESPFLREFMDRTGAINKRIAFSDGNDIRLAKALNYFQDFNNSTFHLIGNDSIMRENIKEAGIKNTDRFFLIDPKKSSKAGEYRDIIKSSFKARNKEISDEKLDENVLNTSYWAGVKLKNDEADCAVGGSISSTADLMRAVIYVLGLTGGKKSLCGAALVDVPDCIYGINGKFCLADPAIIPKPTEEQMIEMVLSTHETAKAFLGKEPFVAMLSYSTKGSAESEEIDKIRKVMEKVKKINPNIKIDGELQFDAAIVPEVAKIKLSESEVAGKANVLIFPDLNSANIGYKIIQRLAKAEVCGTVIQGAAKPFNDLSRGCNVEDIIYLTAMTLLQRKGMEDSNLL